MRVSQNVGYRLGNTQFHAKNSGISDLFDQVHGKIIEFVITFG